MVRLSLLRPGSAGRTHQNKSRGRGRAIATTGVLCLPALGESGTYPAVSGGGGGSENRNAPNDTAALGFVENSEAARYVFVVVVIGDVMSLAVCAHSLSGVLRWAGVAVAVLFAL